MNEFNKKKFYKELIGLMIPLALQNLLASLIGATDALMLGRLSQEAVAAVSLANQVAFIMNMFTYAIISGGGVLLAQYWGKGDVRTVQNMFCMLIKFALGVTFIFFVGAFFFPETLMRIYTNEPELIEIGAGYLRIVSFSYLFSVVLQCYYTMMKIEGKAAKSVVISVATLVADVVLDLFLIYGLAGVPKLGANGSAYSTIAVEVLGLVWCVAESYKKGGVRVDIKGMLWHSAELTKDFIKVSIPLLASSLAWGIGYSMRSMIMGHMGTDAAAAASIASVVEEVVTCVCKGATAGAGIMIGKVLGQNLLEKAKCYGTEFWKVTFWMCVINAGLMLAVGPVIARFFVLTDTARTYLLWMMTFGALYLVGYSINSVMVCGVFPAGGDSKYDAISVMFSMWCFSIPLALVGAFVFKWPVMLVYIVMCADELVKLPWVYPRYKKYLWLNNLTREDI